MKAIIWKDETVTYKNENEVVTEELKKFNGNKGFLMPQSYLDALEKLKN
jgi:hypothetical protein